MSSSIDFLNRVKQNGVDDLFINRWSPRAFQRSVIEPDTLSRIIEAARWAPSCFNAQPWRFYTSTAKTFDDFLNLLVDANQSWAKDCSVIGFLVAEHNFEYNAQPNSYAQFDCGAAWMSLTLQARMEGYYTHGMGGIHGDKAAEYLQIDTGSQAVVMGFTIGKLLENLSEQQKAEEVPNERKQLSDIWMQI